MKTLLKTALISTVAIVSVGFNARSTLAQNLFAGIDDPSNWTNPSGYDINNLFVDDPFSSGQALSWLNLIDSPNDVDFGITLDPGEYTVSFDILAPDGSLPSALLNTYFQNNFGDPADADYDFDSLATGAWETVSFDLSLSQERNASIKGYLNDLQYFPAFHIFKNNLNLLSLDPTYTGVADLLLGNFAIEAVPEPEPTPEPELSSVLDVLWYGQTPTYNQHISNLASAASSYDPWGDGALDWNLTFWNLGDPTPDFSQYDTLVIGSGFIEWFGFDSSRLLNSKEEIEKARGNRTLLTGQDADLHYVSTPGPRPDGPFGFLVNAVNWTGSGTGLGIVSLPDGYPQAGSQWWLHEDSFLKDELEGKFFYSHGKQVSIPTETSVFPVNEGLSTAGLSDWGLGSHINFNQDIPGYLSINESVDYPGWAVTVVTASEASGGTGGSRQVPEPTSILGMLTALVLGGRSLQKRGQS